MPKGVKQVVCRTDELPPGTRKVIRTEAGKNVVVYNVHGSIYALSSVCPHQAGPVGVEDGLVTGTTRAKLVPHGEYAPEWICDGEIVRCGWHLFEFDIKSGRALTDPTMRLVKYPVEIVDESNTPTIVVEVW